MASTGIDDSVVGSENASVQANSQRSLSTETADNLEPFDIELDLKSAAELRMVATVVEPQSTASAMGKESDTLKIEESVDSKSPAIHPPGLQTSAIEEQSSVVDVSSADTEPVKSGSGNDVEKALVSRVLQKAREAAAGASLGDVNSANIVPFPVRAEPKSRVSDQRGTESSKVQDQRITSALAKMLDQKNTGTTRLPSQSTTGATRYTDQKTTGPTRLPDQSTTGATRFRDQKSTGATPRISDQRATGATPAYVDQSVTGANSVKSLIGRTAGEHKVTPADDAGNQNDESTPTNSKKSLVATIETEAKKTKVSMGLFEKIVSKHPILVGTAAFCIFVVPIYVVVINSQSPSERAENKASWGKDVKLIASKLRKPGELNGHKVSFYVNRADAYIKSDEYGAAIADLKVARQLDPIRADDYNLKLSACYLEVKDFKKACDASADVLKDDPNNVDALIQHGHASYKFGNKLTALDDFFKAVKLDPTNPEVFIERGDYYVAEKKQGSAAADYKHALALAPGLAKAKKKLAACTAVVANHSASTVDVAEASAKLSPSQLKFIADSSVETLRSRGYQSLQKGDLNFAIAALSRAVSLDPNGALVRQYLAHALLTNGAYTDAIEQFDAWDKISVLKLSDKLTFAKRLPADSCPAAATFYEQLIQQYSADGAALVLIARAAQDHGYPTQCESAVAAGEKVCSAPEKAQLASLKVSGAAKSAADVQSGKIKIEN